MDKLSYSDRVGVTCLPPEGAEISPNIDVKNRDNWNNCFIAGWGRLGTGAQVPPKQASKYKMLKLFIIFSLIPRVMQRNKA